MDAKKRVQHLSLIMLFIFAGGMTTVGYCMKKREWVAFYIAEWYQKLDNFRAAVRYYRSAQDLGAPDILVLEGLGQSYLALNMPKRALSVYKQLARLKPHSFPVARTVAGLYDHFGKVDKALAIYEDWASQRSRDRVASYHYSQLLVQAQKLEDAKASLQKHISDYPLDHDARLLLADVARWLALPQESLDVLEDIPTNTLHREVAMRKSKAHSALGELDEAKAILSSLLKESKADLSEQTDQTVVRQLLLVTHYRGEHREVADLATLLKPADLNSAEVKAIVDSYAALEKHAVAEDTLDEYLAAHPDDRQAQIRLAKVLGWQKKYDRSLKTFSQLVLESPEDVQIRRQYAQLLSWAGHHKKAAHHFEKSLRQVGASLPY